MSYGWDETWRRLLGWTGGQGPAERLAAQVLYAEGYERVDPSHPLGGPDGGKDALAHKGGLVWAMAAYFPRDQQSFAEIKAKFLVDVAKAGAAGADAVAFVTNQELRLAERRELEKEIGLPLDLFHLERLTAVLDRPAMHAIRAQFLNIAAPTAIAAPPEPTWHDFVAAAPRVPGGPEHWVLHDGFLLMRTLVLPAPPGRHPEAAAPTNMLASASRAAIAVAARWPASVSLLTRRLADGWTADGAHRWAAGRMSSVPQRLVRGPRAAVAFDTRTGALAVERTWPTALGEDDEPLAYRAAREPDVLAEMLVAVRLAGTLLAAYDAPVDIAFYIGAVGDEQGRLVSSQRAVSGPRFGPPVARVSHPRAEVPGRHLDSARFEIEDLVNPYRAAEVLVGPWLATFRDDDLLAKLAADE
jgi:hypothetical protein